MSPLPFILIEAGTAACSLFAIEQYPQLVDEYRAAQSAIQHHRIAHIGHVSHASTMLLMHAHHIMAQGPGRVVVEPGMGIERIPELQIPFVLRDFDIPEITSMAFYEPPPTPRNGHYKNRFTSTNAQPKRIERTTRSRP